MDKTERIDKFIIGLENEKLVKKNLRKYSWLSGSSTQVSSITIWRDSVELQWNSDRRIFDKFIKRIMQKNEDLIAYGYFWKSDGSCPSKIVFKFTEEYKGA